jgi:hypothetical protein
MDHAEKISTIVNFDVDMDDCKKLKNGGGGGRRRRRRRVLMLRVVSTSTYLWHCLTEEPDRHNTPIQGKCVYGLQTISPLTKDNFDNYVV